MLASCAAVCVLCCAVPSPAWRAAVLAGAVGAHSTFTRQQRTMKLNTFTSFTVPFGYAAGALQQHAAAEYWVALLLLLLLLQDVHATRAGAQALYLILKQDCLTPSAAASMENHRPPHLLRSLDPACPF